ncbi:MAG: hypothetical protein R3C44_01095 [Chloroflexota bacterium]
MEQQEYQPKPTLTDRLRQWTKPVIDPVVTFLARLGVSPDMLTLLGFFAHFLFAYLIAIGEMRWAAVAIVFLAPLDAWMEHCPASWGASRACLAPSLIRRWIDWRKLSCLAASSTMPIRLRITPSWWRWPIWPSPVRSWSVTHVRVPSLWDMRPRSACSVVERYVVLVVFLFLNLPEVALGILAFFTYFTFFQRMYSVWQQSRSQE